MRNHFDNPDTIAALCTPQGASICAIIRISGDKAFKILTQLFNDNLDASKKSWSMHRGNIELSLSESVPSTKASCPAVAYLMPGPKSYTCEDVAEVHIPGCPALAQAALRTILENGARLADPGEFTMRAFLGGRLDLGQAEAVERVVRAGNESARREALRRLDGELSKSIVSWREELVTVAATLEAVLDFEEEELGAEAAEAISANLALLSEKCLRISSQASSTTAADETIRFAFAGLTNAGKSSLINALCGYERSITSAQPSTTRDALECNIQIGRFSIMLEDLPGLDTGGNELAQKVSQRATKRMQCATAVCLVIDASLPVDEGLSKQAGDSLQGARVILILNKSDLAAQSTTAEWVSSLKQSGVNTLYEIILSANSGEGINKLTKILEAEAMSDEDFSSTSVINAREAESMRRAAESMIKAKDNLENDLGLEVVAEEIRDAYDSLSRILGVGYAEEILESIFSRFCIGK